MCGASGDAEAHSSSHERHRWALRSLTYSFVPPSFLSFSSLFPIFLLSLFFLYSSHAVWR
ncbi:hypothetical protein Sjap_018408 [Stephania japonica]|uniref:Uncharacterized protein n=1 Tax=Stephania japonica TaxID=461633 RepID=A0AAP0NKH2_9MAGN